MQDSLQFNYLFKYILVGDTSVGKSSILCNYISNQFHNTSNPTMGVQFATKKVEIHDQVIRLQIWDTAGQESFRTITRAYYKNAIGVLLVYDLTNPKSIASLESWLTEIEDNSNDKAEIIIIGNKKDLVQEGLELPESMTKFKKYLSSAKTGYNVGKIFTELTASVLEKIRRGQIRSDGTYGVKKGNMSKGTKLRMSQDNESSSENSSSSKCC